MLNNQVVVITPQELQRLIYDAVNVAVQQIRLPQKDDPLPEYMSIDQASQFLNLAVPTLYGLTSKRQVPFIKKSKKLYFLKSQLEKWLNDSHKKTTLNLAEDAKNRSKNQ